jgi:hypothetical protein
MIDKIFSMIREAHDPHLVSWLYYFIKSYLGEDTEK